MALTLTHPGLRVIADVVQAKGQKESPHFPCLSWLGPLLALTQGWQESWGLFQAGEKEG